MFKIDPTLREKNTHGTFLLPIQDYHCMIPEHFSVLPIHWHEEMEITLITKGCALYHIHLEPYPVKENDLIIIPPFFLHDIHQIENKPMASDSFVFHLDILNLKNLDACSIKYLSPLYDGRYTLPYFISPSNAHYNDFLSLFNRLRTVYKHKEDGFELNIKAILFEFIALLFSKNIIMKNESVTMTKAHSDKLKIVLDYIHQNLNRSLCVKELATLCNFNESYFMKFFRKYCGMTSIEYINTQRLELCATYLKESDLSIMDIALEVGFNNISYFNKLFKAKYNMTPKKYRLTCNKI